MSRQGTPGWMRRHPRTTTAVAALVLVSSIIGAIQGAGHPADHRGSLDAPASDVVTSLPGLASTSAPLAGPSTARPRPSLSAVPADISQAGHRTAIAVLAALRVKGRAAKTGYDRAEFGSAWTDANDDPLGHNGCDTRNDVLRRDLSGLVLKTDSNGCTVLAGALDDPYTGARIAFHRGATTSAAVQIDHIVALSDAWQTGAQYWNERRRIDFANDPLELLAVDGPANESKGDGDAATWLPHNKAYRCAYVARQVAVKARYGLWVTFAEHEAIGRVLASCPAQVTPTEPGSPPSDG